jgi:hypothetical protein
VLEVQRVCQQTGSPVVFAHNDLLSGNIMVSLEEGEGPVRAGSACLPVSTGLRGPFSHLCKVSGSPCFVPADG